MTDQKRSFVLGSLLLLLAVVWTWLVIDTIPPGFGEGDIGARAFPLIFGICLGVLSLLLLINVVRSKPECEPDTYPNDSFQGGIHWLPAGLILIEISGYGYLLNTCGFVIATPIVVLFVMFVNLRIRSAKLLFGMSIGLTLACWLIFEKALGIYLANGSWINIG
ncbi:MAG: putative tricarboxylic transport membrane protein [Candidatus Paceibacteria bacterium]|jgi:putative tricarboxylic transport membrane protein